MTEKLPVPIEEGLFTIPSSPREKPRLIGSKCRSCGEVFFPKSVVCRKCFTETTDEVLLSARGRVYTYTVVRRPPPPPWQGTIPFAAGYVELPEGVLVGRVVFTGCAPEAVHIGMEVEFVPEKWGADEMGHDVLAPRFTPVQRGKAG